MEMGVWWPWTQRPAAVTVTLSILGMGRLVGGKKTVRVKSMLLEKGHFLS